MPGDTALKQRADILKATRKLLLDKLQELQRQAVIYTVGDQGFQVQQELARAQQDLKALDQQLKDIDGDRIYYALLEMNYFDQSMTFGGYIQAQRIGAFLIHGPAGYGQDWLLRRLLELIPGDTDPERIEIDLGSPYLTKEVDALWDQLAQRLQLDPFPPPSHEQIAKTAASWLETKTVIFILQQIDAWAPQQANALIQEFWKGLVQAAQETLKAGTNTRLLMFLVDYSDLVSTWNLPLVDASAGQAEPAIPVRLQNVSPFTTDEVKPWVKTKYLLYQDLLQPLAVNLDQNVQAIIDSSQGVPDEVAKNICLRCQHYYQKARWLKL